MAIPWGIVGVSRTYLGESDGISWAYRCISWASHGTLRRYTVSMHWASRGDIVGVHWASQGTSHIISCASHEHPIGHCGHATGIPWDTPWDPIEIPWDVVGIPGKSPSGFLQTGPNKSQICSCIDAIFFFFFRIDTPGIPWECDEAFYEQPAGIPWDLMGIPWDIVGIT